MTKPTNEPQEYVLEVEDLRTHFFTDGGDALPAVDGGVF